MENTAPVIEQLRVAIVKDMLEGYLLAQKYLEQLINATPSGKQRNELTEQNIKLCLVINALKD